MRGAVAGAVLAMAALVWPRASSPWRLRRGWARPDGRTPPGLGGSMVRLGFRRWSGSRRIQRELDRRTVEVLDLLDALAPTLRAGLPPGAALRAVSAPSGDRRSGLLDALLDAADRGAHLAPVWRAEAEALGSSDLGLVAAAWALCEALGSPLATTVTTVSRVVRQRLAVRHRMEAALAGPRASMSVLTALPAAGPLLALTMGVSPLDLYSSPAGAAALVAGVGLVGVGRRWGARLVASVGVEGPAGGGRRGPPGEPGSAARQRRPGC